MIAYTDSGNGFPIILIHGFCEDKSIWENCTSFLSNHYRVIAIDLPGFGESRFIESEISIDYFANQLNEFLIGLKIEKCLLIGHSLGGYVALSFVDKYPKKVAGFGLFHSTAFEDSEEKKENRLKAIQFIQRHGMKAFAESFVPPLFSLENRNKFSEEIKALIKVAASSEEIAVIETTRAMRNRKEYIPLLKKCNVPVLFVIGKIDGAVPLDKSLEQCYLPKNSVCHFLEDVGHMGMIENKELSQKILLNFANYCLS